MTTAPKAAYMRQFRIGDRDNRVHQGAAADPTAGSSVSQGALTNLTHRGNAAYQSAQGAAQAKTALSKATLPPLQQGQARTDAGTGTGTGTGERQQTHQTDRTTNRSDRTL